MAPLFGPDSMMWRINREAVLLLGGRAALLMQLAHPLVAAGVAQHSRFPSDSIKRLRRTLDLMLTIVFGDEDDALDATRAVNAVHEKVRGHAPDGRSYDARDPHLLLWVNATLVDSSIRVYEACVARLTDEQRALYYEETKIVSDLFGIPTEIIPPTLADLRAWMDEMIECGEVVVTPLARELAEPIIRPLRIVPAPLASRSTIVTAALLPDAIRDGYGLKLSRPGRALLALGLFTSRSVLPRAPQLLRAWPVARRAYGRSA